MSSGEVLARGPDAKQPLDEQTAMEMWREITGFAENVYLTQEITSYESEVKASGKERGKTHLRISIGGDLDSGQVKMIQSVATAAGRDLVVSSGSLRIY